MHACAGTNYRAVPKEPGVHQTATRTTHTRQAANFLLIFSSFTVCTQNDINWALKYLCLSSYTHSFNHFGGYIDYHKKFRFKLPRYCTTANPWVGRGMCFFASSYSKKLDSSWIFYPSAADYLTEPVCVASQRLAPPWPGLRDSEKVARESSYY